ncbi:hypothetical protein [Rhizobacter sp. Root1221]|uniref:hypothetical protein n=1 Tax=Rhizobacter sp. Root1221 TaxID=1736433 RepID=UPI001F47A299|nr:hypothetical protein [Rhizobacter sp. Root1221]
MVIERNSFATMEQRPMTDPHSTPPMTSGGTTLSPTRRDSLKGAARILGADAASAEAFGSTGTAVFNQVPLAIHALSRQPDGPWVAIAQVARPEVIEAPAWCDALLLANAQAMLLADLAFGLEDNGDAVLLMKMSLDDEHPALLAARLEGMAALCNSVVEGASLVSAAARPEGVPA